MSSQGISAYSAETRFREQLHAVCAVPELNFRERVWVPWLLVLGDIAALELALYLGYFTRQAFLPWWPVSLGPSQYAGPALGVLFFPIRYYVAGLYPGYGLGAVEKIRLRVQASFILFGILTAWDYLVQHGNWSRGLLLAALVYALVFPPMVEALLQWALVKRGCWGIPVVVLGAGKTGAQLVSTLRNKPDLGLVPVAFLDDRRDVWNTAVAGVHVIGSLPMAPSLSRRIRVAIVAMPWLKRDKLTALLQNLSFPHVIVIPDLFGMQSLWITPRDLGGTLGLELKRNLLLRRNHIIKRSLDYALGVPLFLLSLPVIGFFAIWIKLVSRGPTFYRQEREGLQESRLRVLKLRTMHRDAETSLKRHLEEHPEERREWERFYKLKKDPRILPGVGRLLRRTSLDEVPQLWNVLKGEMSLVGPRPFPGYHVERFHEDFRKLRQSVLPGITGLWQISARSDGDLAVQQSLDTYYIRNWSLWLDLYILASTLRVVLLRKGAY
jgi:Undecaprenyl-phosphate galactose phosphotransferase WbaP